MDLVQPIARNLDAPFRIMGVSPFELATCVLLYAILNTFLQGLPFATLVSLTLSLGAGSVVLLLNRRFPPHHGLYQILQWFRPRIVSVMPFSIKGGEI